MYLLCPSAKIVSNAKEDFPDPESPVNTTILLRGSSKLIFFKLWVRAPRMIILSLGSIFFLLTINYSTIKRNRPSQSTTGGMEVYRHSSNLFIISKFRIPECYKKEQYLNISHLWMYISDSHQVF